MNSLNSSILVTGAAGFVGAALCHALADAGHAVRRALRDPVPAPPHRRMQDVAMGEIGPETDWQAALSGVDCVIHLAARSHVLRETTADPLAAYRRINVLASERLAQAAAAAGVRRLVFMSSVKVNGELTRHKPFGEADPPAPQDAYGISKMEAETALRGVAAATGLELVIVRPPLVYGPGVKGNFLRLLDLVARRVPLPLAAVRNRRSMIFLGNLVDAIGVAALDGRAAGNTYLVSDGEDVSTPDLIRAVAGALGVPARLFPFPVPLLELGATMLGKNAEIERLTGSLQIDSSRMRRELGWRPRFSFAQGLEQTARWYLEHNVR
ncbi:MAG: UDP-glucose 4-epimerase family protein [Burkholderiales bacterium]